MKPSSEEINPYPRALPPRRSDRSRDRQSRQQWRSYQPPPQTDSQERWRAVVIGPSVLGTGWWIVKKVNGHSAPLMTYTVPEDEIVRVVRRAA